MIWTLRTPNSIRQRRWLLGAAILAATACAAHAQAPASENCTRQASSSCLAVFDLPENAGRMHYYASRTPGPESGTAPKQALLIMHGHPRDANRSFEAALLAARRAGRLDDTLVVAPLFQVPERLSRHCRTPGIPPAQAGDAVWTCAGWMQGQASRGPHPLGAFAALDALIAQLAHQWPSLREVTLAGFSAGAQMLQHSVGFAADPPPGITLRYVIASPGSWLYFDPVRPQPRQAGHLAIWQDCGNDAASLASCTFSFEVPAEPGACEGYDRWKYGLQDLPPHLERQAADARSRYAAARIDYLAGALDSSPAKGAYFRILDKSCAAMLQGPFRLQRGLAYAAYEQMVLHPAQRRPFTVVPGCAHDVACVIPSEAARPSLFPANQ